MDTQVTTSNTPFTGWQGHGLLLLIVFFVALIFSHYGHALATKPLVVPEQLQSYSAKYLAFRNGSEIGFANLDLKAMDNHQYQLRFSSDASLFLIYDKRREVSVFSLYNQQLLPISYRFEKRSNFKDETMNLRFNRETDQIVLNQETHLPWQQELDHQLYRLAAQWRLQAGQESFAFDLINYRGQPKHYQFKVEGQEELTLPFGKLQAIKLKTIRQSKKRTTYSWFAPELDYLLVRIRQFKNGKEQGDIQLSEYQVQK